ncbi:MAG: NAD(P)-binding domain-containing protein [Dongiaceae bacterium]
MASPDPTIAPAPALLAIGIRRDGAGAPLRERLLPADRLAPMLLDRLAAAKLGEALLLATPERCEIYAVSAAPAQAIATAAAVFAELCGLTRDDAAAAIESRRDGEAMRGLFLAAAAFEGTAGDVPVPGALEAAHRTAAARGLVGRDLETILAAAYEAAGRVRREAAPAVEPTSMAAAAVQAAIDLHGDLGTCQTLLIGAGDMGQLLADELVRAGLKRLTVVHPNESRAALIARQHQCHYRPWSELDAALAAADIVLSALGDGRQTLSAAAVRAALKRRRLRPMLLVDAALPSDIEPAVGDIDDAFRYDLEDLERIALGRLSRRKAAADAGLSILEAELAAFLGRWTPAPLAAPAPAALARLRAMLEAERRLAAGGPAEKEAGRAVIERLLQRASDRFDALAAEVGPRRAEAMMAEAIERLLGDGHGSGKAGTSKDKR